MSDRILSTKLYSPLVRANSVKRQRLLDQLNLGLARQHRLTLVSAPAGFGKTTLISAWLALTERPYIWLSLDSGDNELMRFVGYLLATLQRLQPEIGVAVKNLFGMASFPPIETVAVTLINEINTISTPFLLVLDDYHLLQNPYCQELVELLIKRQPDHLHLVLITREDPALPLARLRAGEQMTEIRATDLEFNPQEARSFFNQTMSLSLEDSAITALVGRTEGWIAGLQLAALSLTGRTETEEFIKAFSGTHRYVIDYLVEEVLGQQAPEIRQFLTQTAILERLCAPLCEAVTGRADSKAMLAHLEKANLFLIPLDDQRQWYRYHHLFAEFLQTELDPAEEALLHNRALSWYEKQGLLYEAIRHALAAHNIPESERLIGLVIAELIQKGELATLLSWLESIPLEVVQTSPDLGIYKSWGLYLSGQIEKAEACFTSLDTTRLSQLAGTSLGRLKIVQIYHLSTQETALKIRLAEEALALIGDSDPLFRTFALTMLGVLQNVDGQTTTATSTFQVALVQAQAMEQPPLVINVLLNLVANLNRQGQRGEALWLCQENLNLYTDSRGQFLLVAGMLLVPMALLSYEANELEDAYQYVTRGLEIYERLGINPLLNADGQWILVKVLRAKGQTEKALTTIRKVRQTAEHLKVGLLEVAMAGLEAEILCRQGYLQKAAYLLEKYHFSSQEPPNPIYEIAYLSYIRVLLAQHRLLEAETLLDVIENNARVGGRYARLIPIHILQARTQDEMGDREAALQYLSAAINLAAPESYLRYFLDENDLLLELLPQTRALAPAFVDSLMVAFSDAKPAQVEATNSNMTLNSSPIEPLIEALNAKELEILRLISIGLSNEEIARKQVITLGTTKWYLSQIYGKLGVKSRTQALARTRQLNLL